MYKEQKVVVEDVIVGKNCGIQQHLFTGGKSTLQLPVTVSFTDTGKYTVNISERGIIISRIEEDKNNAAIDSEEE